MKKTLWWKILVIAIVGIAIVVVMQLKAQQATDYAAIQNNEATVTENSSEEPPVTSAAVTESNTTGAPATDKPATTDTRAAKAAKNAGEAVVPSPSDPATPKAAPIRKATFIELGADKCIPCKMMQPIMDELRQEYPATLKVVFHDVWKDPSIADKYGVDSIPTQVLLNGDGEEIFRHVGFWPKDEIVSKFKELGIPL